jgi:hypothetical protein
MRCLKDYWKAKSQRRRQVANEKSQEMITPTLDARDEISPPPNFIGELSELKGRIREIRRGYHEQLYIALVELYEKALWLKSSPNIWRIEASKLGKRIKTFTPDPEDPSEALIAVLHFVFAGSGSARKKPSLYFRALRHQFDADIAPAAVLNLLQTEGVQRLADRSVERDKGIAEEAYHDVDLAGEDNVKSDDQHEGSSIEFRQRIKQTIKPRSESVDEGKGDVWTPVLTGYVMVALTPEALATISAGEDFVWAKVAVSHRNDDMPRLTARAAFHSLEDAVEWEQQSG